MQSQSGSSSIRGSRGISESASSEDLVSLVQVHTEPGLRRSIELALGMSGMDAVRVCHRAPSLRAKSTQAVSSSAAPGWHGGRP